MQCAKPHCYHEIMITNRIKTMTRSDWIALCAISLVVSFCAIFGISYVAGKGWPIFHLHEEVLLSLLLTPVTGVILVLLEAAIHKNAASYAINAQFIGPIKPTWRTKATRVLSALSPKFTTKSIIGFSLLMALLWLPWYIANFPGGTYWDTYYQMFQVYPENHPIAVIPWADIYDKTLTDAWLVDHHPIFTTLVYGSFGWVSDQLTGNWMAGVAIFCILQGLAHNFVFTGAVAYMRKIGCPTPLNFISYWFFALMPFVSTWALCMVKDSFFGLFYVPYFMFVFEILQTRGKIMGRSRNAVLFAICALLLCLTKKTGIFVVVATCIVGLIAFARRAHKTRPKTIKNLRASIKALAAQGVLCLLVVGLILPALLFPALNIRGGGLQEVLGPMFQQTARYIVDHEDDVTIKERNVISKVLTYERLEDEYAFDFEDSVKFQYNLDATPEQLVDYFATYVAQGFRHPDSYFAAIMSLAGFYVAPTAFINIRMVTVDTKMGEDDRYMLWNPDELDWLREGLDDAYTAVAETPGVDLPLLIVTYAFWLPAVLAFAAWRNRLKSLLLFVPALILLGFCVIAPVYDARYVIPIFDAAPLFLCAVIVLARQTALLGQLSRQSANAAVTPYSGNATASNLSPIRYN